MNQSIKLQLVLVAIALVLLFMVALFPPKFKAAPVQFDDPAEQVMREALSRDRDRRQGELDSKLTGTPASDSAGTGMTGVAQTPGAATPAPALAESPAPVAVNGGAQPTTGRGKPARAGAGLLNPTTPVPTPESEPLPHTDPPPASETNY